MHHPRKRSFSSIQGIMSIMLSMLSLDINTKKKKKSKKKSQQILVEIDITKIFNYNKISWHHNLIKEGKHKTLLWKNILFRRNLFFTLLMSWQFRVAESRQFCLMSKTSLPRDIKFNLKMITDYMCLKNFCNNRTHNDVYSWKRSHASNKWYNITLCVVCVFVTIFRCLVVAKSNIIKGVTRRDPACGSFLLRRWNFLFTEHIIKIFSI